MNTVMARLCSGRLNKNMELKDGTLQFPYYHKIAESNNQYGAAKILNSLINTHKFS